MRPFGFNEFDGAGSGYAIKFASLVDIDENVIVESLQLLQADIHRGLWCPGRAWRKVSQEEGW